MSLTALVIPTSVRLVKFRPDADSLVSVLNGVVNPLPCSHNATPWAASEEVPSAGLLL